MAKLQPKKLKYRKQFRGKMRGKAGRGNTIAFGEYALKALKSSWVTNNQIEAARVTIGRKTKKGGKLWIRIFPDKPVSSKPVETGMGGGKGDVKGYVAVVKAGRVLFEVAGVSKQIAHEALRLASHKLPMKTKIVSR